MTVTDIRAARPWSEKSRNHGWDDIDVNGDHHECRFCGVRYHSEPDGTGGYIKAWTHGVRSGRSKSMGRCPGPDGRPKLTIVAPAGDVEQVAATPERVATRLCARCNPPCGREARLYAGGWSCAPVVAASSRARAEWLDGLRAEAARTVVAA